ncbi:hypothetical protein, partial [Pseudomonas sp. FSL R10-2398]
LGLLALMAVYFTENRISWVYVQSLGNGQAVLDNRLFQQNRPFFAGQGHPVRWSNSMQTTG